jgi:very-short-patch-repair endonuclease
MEQTKGFIIKAINVHGDMYDYSKVVYVKNTDKIIIICNTHGQFEQTPKGHLRGGGCKLCANLIRANKHKQDINEFITKANEAHDNFYDYSKVEYINSHTRVIITCKLHGEFEQVPNSHLRGSGCPGCGSIKQGETKTSNTGEFVTKAKEVHDNFYDYSKVVYINSITKVIIICKLHGDFEQTPNSHLCSKGCPECKNEAISVRLSSTKPEFITRANEVHDNFYDYSKVEYINSQTKVIITCKLHGDFEQVPNSHLRGSGCCKCVGRMITNQTEFITNANEVHDNLYDYSKVEYINSQTNVIITCKIHGDFEQTPAGHSRGSGCCKCAGRMITNQMEFITKANEVHDNFYDYSKVEYINSSTKVIILCKLHGDFEQTPNSHAQGSGCPDCGSIKRGKTKTFTYDDFITRANEVHDNLYDYSNVAYINSMTKVIITCKLHGDFEQIPNSHLQGRGCNDCGSIKRSELQLYTINDFIARANETHNHKYDYSHVEYTGANNDVIIICKIHGKFNQKPSKHINCKQGCPICSNKTEQKLYDAVKPLYPTLIAQFKQDWCKKITYLPFDFCIPEHNIIIELDGAQHFIQVSNWNSPEETFENDLFKEKCANENGYSIIRILQEDVLNDTYDWFNELCITICEMQNVSTIKNIYLGKNNEYGKFINENT